MYVRLAFAVAAHLEPEILIVDEVLAVGDAEFQKKCLGKMGDVAREGRTVLFVSHNMGAVKSLCPSSILLAGGRIEASGDTHRMTDLYTRKASNLGSKVSKKTGPFSVSITGVSLSISDPAAIQIFAEVGTKEPLDAELRCLLRTNYGAIVGIGSVGAFCVMDTSALATRMQLVDLRGHPDTAQRPYRQAAFAITDPERIHRDLKDLHTISECKRGVVDGSAMLMHTARRTLGQRRR
jgi:ABC-type sulfate/molybdate transport systems ATPase subunit